MRFWLLEAVKGDELWKPWYDKCFRVVVRAESEEQARFLAQKEGSDETGDWFAKKNGASFPAWTGVEHSTCVELPPDEDPKVIIQDIHEA